MPILKPNDTIVFYGDSITDSGRRDANANGIGFGYVAVAIGMLQALAPQLNLRIRNAGVGGDRTVELLERLQADVLDAKPDVVSIKIGVNDLWRKRHEWNGQKYIDPAAYRKNYTELLQRIRAANVRELVLISPTSIDKENDSEFNILLNDYVQITQDLAKQFRGTFVDARTPLMNARAQRADIPWTPDGCHPSLPGHAMIATAWVKTVLGL